MIAQSKALAMLPRFHDEIYHPSKSKKRYQIFFGGAGSGKSYSIAQHLVSLALEYKGLKILCLRKTRPAVKISCLEFVIRVLDSLGIDYELNRTDLELRVRDSTFYFKGVDDPDKFKSSEFHIVWMEEATEFGPSDLKLLNMRCRAQQLGLPMGRMFLSFNPADAQNPIILRFLKVVVDDEGNESVVSNDPEGNIMHSTWRDNPYLPRHDCEQLKQLAEIDPYFDRVYNHGLPGVLKGQIYTNWAEMEGLYFPNRAPDSLGLDLGHTNPTCLVAIWRDEKRLFVRELLYRTGMSTGDLLEWLDGQLPNEWRAIPIYTDPSRPEVIEDIYRSGWNAKGANNKVYDGIMYVRSFEMLVDMESVNTVRELRSYKWKVDKHDNPVDEPVKWMDHAPDAIRYGVFSDRPPMDAGVSFGDNILQTGGGMDSRSLQDWW